MSRGRPRCQRPWLLPRHGHDEVAEFFAVVSAWSYERFEVLDMLVSDTQIGVEIRLTAQLPNGKRIDEEVIYLWNFGPTARSSSCAACSTPPPTSMQHAASAPVLLRASARSRFASRRAIADCPAPWRVRFAPPRAGRRGGAESVRGCERRGRERSAPDPDSLGDRLGDRHAGGGGAGGKPDCALLVQVTAVDREHAEGVDSALIDV